MCRLHPFLAVLIAVALLSGTRAVAGERGAEETLRATFRIVSGSSSSTGFLVAVPARGEAKAATHVMLTAAHAFESMKGGQCKVILRAKNGSGPSVRQEVAVRVRAEDQPLWQRHPEMDVAAIRFDLPDDADMTPFDYAQLADETWAADGRVRVGQDVWIACFPAQLQANGVGWPILRRGSIATFPLAPLAEAKTILIDYSHFGGDSGAPVVAWDGKRPVVVGLVIAMQRQTDKTSTPFEERTVHTPLGLAIAVQSPFLRETVDLLLKKDSATTTPKIPEAITP